MEVLGASDEVPEWRGKMTRQRHQNRRLPRTIAGALVTLLVLGLWVGAAHAEEEDVQHSLSLTFSPIHLLSPILQLTGELRLADKIGVAVILGAGAVTEDDKYYGVWEVGGQFRYYLFGTFIHGMTIGAEVGYMDDRGKLDSPMDSYVGLRAGAFVGYKLATNIGFTLDAQLGDQYVYITRKASDSCWQPIMNLKVGWSF
jgi:hypothetical protein